MNIAIVGSRDFKDYEVVKNFVLENYSLKEDDVIVSGGAHGVDALAEKFASEFTNLDPIIFYADWGKFGSSAGILRNSQIVMSSDMMFAFPTKNSKGTLNSIQQAQSKGIPVYILEVENAK